MHQKASPNQTSGKWSVQRESALTSLFISSLKDINWAEKQLVKILKKNGQSIVSDKLRSAFEEQKKQTEGHVERLVSVFELLDRKATAKKSDAMEEFLIAAAQKLEHYEIATYGTLRTRAATLGLKTAQRLLQQTPDEEKETDEKLSEIAENHVNEAAKNEA